MDLTAISELSSIPLPFILAWIIYELRALRKAYENLPCVIRGVKTKCRKKAK